MTFKDMKTRFDQMSMCVDVMRRSIDFHKGLDEDKCRRIAGELHKMQNAITKINMILGEPIQ